MDRIVGVRALSKPALVLMLPAVAAVWLGSATIAQSPESVDLDAITRIKDEGFERSQVMDTACIASDMMKNAVMTAAFVYHTANREQLLPRKPLPRPTAPARPSTSQGQQ